MHSKNKKAQTSAERAYVTRVKELGCVVCNAPGPSDAHEPEQGLWFCSIALCRDCHMGSENGWHGRRVMWKVMKMNELDAINETVRRVMS